MRDTVQGTIELLGKRMGTAPAEDLTNWGKPVLFAAQRRKEALSTSLLRATCLKKFSYFCQIGTLVADRDKDVRGLLAGIFDTNKKTLRQALHTR